jgi:hypothetical protein
MPTRPALVLAAALVVAGPAAADLAGRVVGSSGRPVPQARVEAAGAPAVFTDARGGFLLSGVDPPAVLGVTHPRFAPREVTVADGAPVEVVIEPKREGCR